MQKGSIEVICGSMFSGKTEELLRRLKRAEFAKMKIAVRALLFTIGDMNIDTCQNI